MSDSRSFPKYDDRYRQQILLLKCLSVRRAVAFVNPKHTSPPDFFLTYSLLAHFKTGVTKQMNLRHLVTCNTNILWLIYMARHTNSNGLNINV